MLKAKGKTFTPPVTRRRSVLAQNELSSEKSPKTKTPSKTQRVNSGGKASNAFKPKKSSQQKSPSVKSKKSTEPSVQKPGKTQGKKGNNLKRKSSASVDHAEATGKNTIDVSGKTSIAITGDESSRTLFVKNLPKNTTEEALKTISNKITSVRLCQLLKRAKVSKCFAYLVFDTKQDAIEHAKSLKEFGGQELFVDFVAPEASKPKNERPVCPEKLFVRGFNAAHDNIKRQLKTIFPKCSSIELPTSGAAKVSLGYAFVKFSTAEDAEAARIANQQRKLGGNTLHVRPARLRKGAIKDLDDSEPLSKKPKSSDEDNDIDSGSDLENFSDLENED